MFRSLRAFTLIELLTVIAIMAALGATSFGILRGVKQRVVNQQAQAEMAVLVQTLEEYRRNYGDFPQLTAANLETELLQALIGKRGPTSSKKLEGRAVLDVSKFRIGRATDPLATVDPFSDTTAVILDPWDQPYRYRYFVESGRRGFVLYSSGPDGEHVPPEDLAALNSSVGVNQDNIYAKR